MDLSVHACGENVPAILDPDQIVHAIAADPALTKGVGWAFGSRLLGFDKGRRSQQREGCHEHHCVQYSSHLSPLSSETPLLLLPLAND
jgi:hypothetical protein